jgi:hypothetical protein
MHIANEYPNGMMIAEHSGSAPAAAEKYHPLLTPTLESLHESE